MTTCAYQAGKVRISCKVRGIIMSRGAADFDLKKDKNKIFFTLPLDAGCGGPILVGIRGYVAEKKRGAGS